MKNIFNIRRLINKQEDTTPYLPPAPTPNTMPYVARVGEQERVALPVDAWFDVR